MTALTSSSGLELDDEVQIVILGSGKDTTYLRSQADLLHDKSKMNDDNDLMTNCIPSTGSKPPTTKIEQQADEYHEEKKIRAKWYEVDYPSVIKSKLELLQSCDLFDFEYEETISSLDVPEQSQSYIITPKSIRTCEFTTNSKHKPFEHGKGKKEDDLNEKNDHKLEPYNLISFDLQDSFQSLLTHMQRSHNFDANQPTLFVMECVQMYLSETSSRSILQTIASQCATPFMAIFDPIIQNDPFGRVMAQNLTKAGITDAAMSMLNCTTLNDQVDKLASSGFKNVTGCDFWNANEMILTMSDRRRANMTEMLDEVEEWMLIMRHYCFLVAAGRRRTNENAAVGNDHDHEEGKANCFENIAADFCSVKSHNVFGFIPNKCVTRGR
jgi:O-methyltransferase involved in polyketide biosynthesis